MDLLPRNQVGLYISSDYIEVCVIEKFLNNIKVKDFFRKNISVQDMEVADQNEIIKNAIKDLFDDNKINKKNIFLNFPTHDVIFRNFVMPRLPKQEWPNAVRFEGQKYVPFKLNEMVSDFTIIDEEEEKSEMDVMFVCSRMTAMSRYISILNSLNITCEYLSSAFISMARLIKFLKLNEDNKPSLILSVKKKVFGRERIRCMADLVLLYNDIPFAARDISVVGTQTEIDEKFLNELFLSVKLFNSALSGKKIENVFLVQGKDTYHWEEFFTENFSCHVKTVDVAETFGVEIADGITAGTALANLVLPKLGVNLMSTELVDINTGSGQMDIVKVAIFELIVAMAIIGVLFVYFTPLNMKIDREIRNIISSMGQYSSIEYSDLKKQKEEFDKKVKFLQIIANSKFNLSKNIPSITEHLKENTWLETVIFMNDLKNQGPKRNSTLLLKGNVLTGDKINDMLFINNFKNDLSKEKVITQTFKSFEVLKMAPINRKDLKPTYFELKMGTSKEKSGKGKKR